VFGRRDILFMNAADLDRLNLAHGDAVEVETALPSASDRRLRLTVIAFDIAPGSVAAYYPEANGLIPMGYQDKESGTPSYKSLPVRVRQAAMAG
jgi:anaerobic selenocysteine-containing dehydrogenase